MRISLSQQGLSLLLWHLCGVSGKWGCAGWRKKTTKRDLKLLGVDGDRNQGKRRFKTLGVVAQLRAVLTLLVRMEGTPQGSPKNHPAPGLGGENSRVHPAHPCPRMGAEGDLGPAVDWVLHWVLWEL